MKELWTAIRKDEEFIYFEVEDKETGRKREEKRYLEVLPAMFLLGGYPSKMGSFYALKPTPWKFEMHGDKIYIKDNGETNDTTKNTF